MSEQQLNRKIRNWDITALVMWNLYFGVIFFIFFIFQKWLQSNIYDAYFFCTV